MQGYAYSTTQLQFSDEPVVNAAASATHSFEREFFKQ